MLIVEPVQFVEIDVKRKMDSLRLRPRISNRLVREVLIQFRMVLRCAGFITGPSKMAG